jgi:hypothetical protein
MEYRASGEGDYPPPSQGDWIISTDTYVKDETIVFDRNITVKPGSKLTLDNVTLMINSSSYGDTKITVQNGSTLNVVNNSIIKQGETGVNYDFVFENGSQGLIANSTIRDCGWNDGGTGQSTGGILIMSSDVIIENSTIQNSSSGIVIVDSSPIVKYNRISHNQNNGISVRNHGSSERLGKSQIIGNEIFDNPIGIISYNTALIITDNVIRDNGDGARLYLSYVNMSRTQVISNAREDCTTGTCSSTESGLGVYVDYVALNMIDVNISDNSDDGLIASNSWLDVRNSTFTDNFGNGITGYHSEINLSNNVFSNNSDYGIEWNSADLVLNSSNSFMNNNGEGRVLMLWDVNVDVVDEYGEDVTNAEVKLTGKSGGHTKEYSQNTNYLGTAYITAAEYEISNDGTNVEYNPYTVIVEKTAVWDGIKYTNTTSIEIREDVFIDIILPLKKPDLKVESLSFSETPRAGTEVKIKVKIANIGDANADGVHVKLTWEDASGIPHILNTTTISVDKSDVKELSIGWTPEDTGRITVSAEITTSYDEITKSNNALDKRVDVEGENPYIFAGLISLLILVGGLAIYLFAVGRKKDIEENN